MKRWERIRGDVTLVDRIVRGKVRVLADEPPLCTISLVKNCKKRS